MIHIKLQFFGGRGSSGNAAGSGGRAAPVKYTTMAKDAEANTLFRASYKAWKSKTTEEERDTIRDYTGSDYTYINRALRNNSVLASMMSDEAKAERFEQASKISSGISKYDLNDNIIVYRGVSLDALGINAVFDSKISEGMKDLVGTVYKDKGFMSTSAVKSSSFTSKEAVMSIKVPKGKGRGAWVSPISLYPYENEFLLQRSSSLKITKAERGTGGKWEIEAELIGNDY